MERKVQPWIEKLNAWAQAQLAEFKSDPYSGKNSHTRKGGGLTDYGVPGGNGGATVIYNHFLSNGNGQQLDAEVQSFLLRSNIVTVVSGHAPHGDCPLVKTAPESTKLDSGGRVPSPQHPLVACWC